MIEEKRNASTYVVGLDIGTRSIVGTVGYRNQNRFIVVAQRVKEHDTRAMLDLSLIHISSNDTPAEEFAYANKLGAIINLDDITHIDFVEGILGRLPETMSCRFNPGRIFELSNGIMDNPGDSKYGFTTEQMFEGYRILKEKGVKNFGMHAFLASNTVTNRCV